MLKKLLFFFFCTLIVQFSFAQCFEVLDGNGAQSDNPYFVSCTPGDFTIFIQPDQTIGPYVINWGDGSANSTGASLTSVQNVSHTYTATTDTFNITITDNGPNNCSIDGVAVLERNPLASIQLPAGDDNFGCTPVLFRFINSTTQVSETTTFEWDFGDGSPTETYDYTNLGDTVLHTYLPGVGVQSCDLEVTLTATNYCGSSTASFFPLKVWDLDEAQITPSSILLCYPDTIVQYTNNTIRNCFPEGNQSQRFERWNFGDYWGLGQDSIIDWRPWNPPITPPPPIGYPGVGVYFVTLLDSSFCGIDATTISIEITNPPTSIITSDKDTICEGETVRFTNSSVGGANEFRWNFDQGSGYQTRNGNPKNRTYNTSGDYTIELVVGIAGAQGCNDTSSVDLHVLPSPSADFTFDPNNECDSMLVEFTNTSTGSITSNVWDFDNGDTYSGVTPPTELFDSPGSYNVELTVANTRGCSNTENQVIQVRETPVSDFTVSSVCLNQLANFIDQSTSGGAPISSYKWYFGDGDSSTAQDPSYLYTSFGDYDVTQIVDNGFCQDTSVLEVVVENEPTASFNPDRKEGCSRLTIQFSNASSANATSFRWNFGDGSAIVAARDTSHVFTNTGISDTTFIVQLIANTTFGCADTTYDTITVFPVPTPSFTSDAVEDCGPVTVNFTNTTQGDSLDYFWDFGDGTGIVNDTNPTHVFENKTLFISNYEVKLVVLSNTGCTDTTVQEVTVHPEPIFTFSANPDSGCSPLSVSFPSVVGALDYQWDFGDGNTASGPTPTHVFVNNTTNNQVFQIRLIAQNSFRCLDTTFGEVLVYPNPTSDFELDTNVGCQPLPIQITNNSVGANFFDWSFGDGTTSDTTDAAFIKTYENTTTLSVFNTIRLITETDNGCKDTMSRVIEIHPFIEASFIFDSVGCSPYPVSFNNQSTGAQNFQWNFGDGNTSPSTNPDHIYENNTNSIQTYTAKLIVNSPQGCLDSTEKDILVYPKPTSSFSLNDSAGCHPLLVNLTNNSLLSDSCAWKFGDGDTFNLCSPSINHTYSNTTSFFPVNYSTKLFVFSVNGCKDTSEKVITVNPQVIADFDSIGNGCTPHLVRFQNQSTGAQNFEWTFGDGKSSIANSPSNAYVNQNLQDSIFTANLKITSQYGCTDSLERDIEVFAKPIASFSLSDSVGCHPLEVEFTNNSSISDSCRWNFGDGSSINDTCFIRLERTYTNLISSIPLERNAQLFVYTNNGCLDTTIKTIKINPEIVAQFDSVENACSPYQVLFRNQSTGAGTYDWSFGDGDNSITLNPNHEYINPNQTDITYQSKLVVNSQFGCSDSIIQNITVFAKPIADFSIDESLGCQPLIVEFTNNSSSASDSCVWVFGDGSADFDSCFTTYSKTYTNTQSFNQIQRNAQLFVYTTNGCTDNTEKVITVNPDINADFDSVPDGCHPFSIDFRNQSTGVKTYEWFYGDGGGSPQQNPSYTFVNFGLRDTIFKIKLRTTNDFGCVDSVEQDITIFAKPTADYSVNTNAGCQPLEVEFIKNSTLTDSCRWLYGDGNELIDCSISTTHTYTNKLSLIPVNYNSQLIIITDNGCSDSLNRNILVNPEVIADFTAPDTTCSPLDAEFRSESFGAVSYYWDFDDGRVARGMITNNTFTNTGSVNQTFNVQLIAESLYGCNDTLTKAVVVRPTPVPDFSPTPEKQLFPSSTVTVDNTTNPGNWIYDWNFGDATTSDLRDPAAHTYVSWGQYEIQLKASTIFCSDSISKLVEIEVPFPVADFDDSASGCQPLEVTFNNKSLYGRSYLWNFGDGNTSNAENPSHIYFDDGVYSVSLTVTGFEPNKIDDTLKFDYIKVFKTPIANFITNRDEVFVPNDPIVMSNRTVNADSYSWDFGDGNSSTERSPTHLYTVPGEYQIRLIAASDDGCIDTSFAPNLVTAELEGRIKVPNAFTPNRNGSNGGRVNINPGAGEFNDVFYAKVSGTTKYELNIFNKWGELLFVSTDINVGWDGYYRGELSKQDAYVWKVSAEFADGTSVVKVGDLMLLR